MEKKNLLFGVFLLGLVLAVSVFVIAKPNVPNSVVIPDHAIQVSNGVFSLGSAQDANGRMVEGFVVFHHREGHNKGGGDSGDTGGSNTCYSFLSNGAKWNNLEDWVVNPANGKGLSDAFVLSNLGDNIQKWETESGADILGYGSLTTDTLSADMTSPIDNVNEVYFADVDSPGAIAVTIVWGVFRGPPSQRGLVSWDMVFDNVDYDWSDSGEADKMDFENIAAHEMGHAVGMGHAPTSADCANETMYPTAGFGEIDKRTLEAGDIAGINALY